MIVTLSYKAIIRLNLVVIFYNFECYKNITLQYLHIHMYI